MMGLRAENDQASTNFFSGSQNRKTYRFAEKYHGRFFVSGVSGSFQKYTKQLKETDKKYLKNEKTEKKYTFEPLLEKHQKEELRREALRLLEMEEQLAKLQKMRELKRKRDRERRKKKQEFMSACCIQRSFRAYIQYKRNTSADVLVSFLRKMYARQSLSAASWASRVIQRFAVKASYMWKERQLRRRRARLLALESWHVIREVASIWTLARRATTDEFVFNCLKVGSQHATQAILDSGAFLRPKKSKPSKKPPTASMKAKKGPKEDHLAFFLTEFDNNDDHSANEEEGGYNGDSDDDEDDERFLQTRKSIKFTTKNHSSVEDLTASAQEFLRLSKRQTPAKVYDPNKPDHKRIIEMHKRRLNDFKQERLRRMQAVDQKKDQDEREAAGRAKAEEAARQSAEQAKKEYQVQLAQEAREKARHEAKLRAEREALKAKRAAQEKLLLAERTAMQAQDKPQYQQAPAGMVKAPSKGPRRPASGRTMSGMAKSESATGVTRSNTADIDTDNETGDEPARADAAPAPVKTFVKMKTKPVIDQTAVDAEYYQKALPPKRPHVPRVNTDGGLNKAKQKQLEEQEAIEKEAMIQMEVRRQKYTSEEAVKASRLAVQRRVAAKLERAAQKVKEAEAAEAEKKEKMQQIAAIAQERLKADLEKKKKKEAERRAKLGIATPPDFFALPSVGAAGKHRKPRKKNKHGHAGDGSDASASETEFVQRAVSGDSSSRGNSGNGHSNYQVSRNSVENKRYAHADSGEDDDHLSESDHEDRKGEEDDPLNENGSENGDAENRHVEMGDALSDGDDEGAAYSPINPHHESENERNSDSDSLDAMLKGLSHSLRQQNKQPAPQGASPAPFKQASNAVGSTRSSSAGANDSPARLTRHTSSGGDSRTFTAERKNTLSPHSPQAGHAFERADISSAHEHFDDLMENFRADDFFRQSSVVRLLHTNASGELVEGKGASDKPKKMKTKKLVIPKHLQNTPYFKHYQKHTEGLTESTSAAALHWSEGSTNVKKAHLEESDGATIKATSKVPLLARKKQLATELQSAALAGSVSAPVLLDESALKLQHSHHMKPGKVASLMEMVTKARIKLKNGGTAVDSATEASEAETDTEPHKVSHSKHSAAHNLSHVGEHALPGSHHHVHPSQQLHHASGTGTGRVTPQMSYKAATDAELDAFVPSLQPPSVPSALPVPALSFSRKTLGPAGIPLPPLSKDNLTILLKGKDPDALQAQQLQQQQAKPFKKSSKKVSKNKDDTKAPALAEKDSAKLSRKAAVPKTKTSGLTASNKSRKSLSGRYAHAFEEDGDEEMGDDLHLFSPDQRRHQGVNGNHLYSSQVKFAPEDEAFDADEEEANSDQELEEAEQLQEEYSRLRSEFNAKLQQAAAFNQVRQSSQRDSHDDNTGEDFHEGHEHQYYENEANHYDEGENPDEAPLTGVAASGSVTQSYSEGIPKISTQDLLRMWAIEDAEEEAMRVSESQKAAQPVGAGASEKASSKTGDVYSVITAGVAEPSRGDANIRVSSKHNDNNSTASLHGSRQSSGRGSGSRYAQYDHQDEASSDEEVQNTTALRRSTNSTPQQPGNNASFKAADGVVPIPVKTLPADDAGLDDACLSFMNKMATKLPVPKI